MKSFFTSILLFLGLSLGAQNIIDFEDFSLEPDSFYNGIDLAGGFTSGMAFFPNSYDTAFNSWQGWAVSNKTDTATAGPPNQYSARPGMGADSSSNYAVFFSFAPNIIRLQNEALGKPVPGMMVTNGTYPYLSLKNGDQFAKKFGGVSGDDPDFFLLTIKAYSNGTLSTDSVDFYLADYRFEDNTLDYIVDEWTFVDLYSLGNVDSLSFSLSSSDSGMFGMNTPAYFCADNIGAEMTTGLFSLRQPELSFSVYPNPSSDFISFTQLEEREYRYAIYTLNGVLIEQAFSLQNNQDIDVRSLASGTYLLRVWNKKGSGSSLFIKR